MARPLANKEAQEIFKKLQQSPLYVPGYEKEKRTILGKLLGMKKEIQHFATTPGTEEYQINGYLVECCAQFSTQIPCNTPKAEHFSRTIISYLMEHGLHTPDYVWMKIHGRRITITGLGEVKSHPRVVSRNPSQALYQKQNIEKIVENGFLSRLLGTKAKIVYEQKPINYLVVPRRDANRYFHLPLSMPLDWEIREIEFSFPEIMFLKPLLLNDPEPIVIAIPYPKHLYEPFVNMVIERMDTIVAQLFQKVPSIKKPSTRSALMAWNIVFKTIPSTQDGVDNVLRWAQQMEHKNIFVPLLLATTPQSVVPVCKGNSKSATTLNKCFKDVPNIESLIAAFLSRVQEVRNMVCPIMEPTLIHKKDIDLLTVI
ncbi:MAG: hypothetical protein Q8R40_02900 [bacterium]|nr:hypothetical protein [bacterium]